MTFAKIIMLANLRSCCTYYACIKYVCHNILYFSRTGVAWADFSGDSHSSTRMLKSFDGSATEAWYDRKLLVLLFI